MTQLRMTQVQNRDDQCGKILKLLTENEFVSTKSLLNLGIYQYNARIFELRRGYYDNIIYNIISIKYNSIYGFKLEK